MPAPKAKHKLAYRLGRMIRTSTNGPWIWQRWDKHGKKWVTIPTNRLNRSEAEQWVYQQAAMRTGETFVQRGVKVLFSEVANSYTEARRTGDNCKRLRASSILKIQTALSGFRSFVGRGYGTLTVDRVDAGMLKDFVDNETARLCGTAAQRNVMYIGQILKFAAERNLISHAPKPPKVFKAAATDDPKKTVNGSAVPTAVQVRQILEAAEVKMVRTGRMTRHGRPIYKGINENDYSDFFRILCMTGMRIGEACFLTWSDVDLNSQIIKIQAGVKNGLHWQPKTKASNRRIPIVPELLSILEQLRSNNRRDQWVFESKRGTQLQPCNVQKRFRAICDSLKFEQRFTVHSLRKYWASTVAMQGMDSKMLIKMFGHTDFELILSTYYAQNDDERLINEANKIDFGLDSVQDSTTDTERESDE